MWRVDDCLLENLHTISSFCLRFLYPINFLRPYQSSSWSAAVGPGHMLSISALLSYATAHQGQYLCATLR